ncbi:interferon-induced GTP-binding protein Mx-like [Triplophysa rosa]|uniref:interferon-induced GTP-binding protein Mx-like n=1 Tax=Triplophysa rosa TaxID=992332 RepID=UPI002545FA43|nr:interferon-induced GTP-binding protein Mx-like [Triplophysa rosa]
MDSKNTSQGFLSYFSNFGSSEEIHDEDESFTLKKKGKKTSGVFHDHLEERIRPFIDLIDTLRSVGVQKELALPTIVVIGDQSSGKSSVLEALSGVSLPRGSGIVTRCPLELKLRQERSGINWKASISYGGKNVVIKDPSSVEQHISEAQNELAGKGVGICDEPITLTIMSPNVCDLTLIDLPGIARVPVQGQPEDIGKQIKNLIFKYIEKTETLNMVVVPCNIDIATTEALKMAQEVDPDGKRTIAVLTKPDLMDKGTEHNILNIIRNKVIPLSKGYILVKCRGQKQIDENISLEMATQMEAEFFKNHEVFSCLMNEDKATVKCLATKLSQCLVDHIKKSLPLLSEKIKRQIWDLKSELKGCESGPPLDPQEAKNFLITTLTGFNDMIKDLSLGELINGELTSRDLNCEDNLFVQLRAEFKSWNDNLDQTKESFQQSIRIFKDHSQKCRGRELLGFSNYKVIEKLLQECLKNLKDPAIESLSVTKDIIHKQFTKVSEQCFKSYPYLLTVTKNKIDNIHLKQQAKAEQRILEQFEMENLIFTQDAIYLKVLNEIGKPEETFSEDNLPVFDNKSMYSEMLQAYYQIVVQRMADQVPMLILYLMLRETARLLRTEMLSLMDGAQVNELLCEDSDVSRKRIEIQTRLDRLNIAQERMCNSV